LGVICTEMDDNFMCILYRYLNQPPRPWSWPHLG